jgi:hypothetical protein
MLHSDKAKLHEQGFPAIAYAQEKPLTLINVIFKKYEE